MKLHKFLEFVNESQFEIVNPGWLCKRYLDDLDDFEFERDLPVKIDQLQKDYSLFSFCEHIPATNQITDTKKPRPS